MIFFFFKQKTAYEMRISDWSSDVCSSSETQRLPTGKLWMRAWTLLLEPRSQASLPQGGPLPPLGQSLLTRDGAALVASVNNSSRSWRSEEHTSELQSLMRISYDVFCLKKKHNNTRMTNIHKYT